MVTKPYNVLESGDNWEIRLFENYLPEDLVWHRDKETREVELLEGNCKLQLDNELPKEMINNKIYRIKKLVYHRVIADSLPFKVKIKNK